MSPSSPLTVAWISFFPVEWLPDAPEEVRALPRLHAASWQRVLLAELEKNSGVRLHVIVLRKQFPRDMTFERNGVTFHLIKTPGGLRAPTLFWLDTFLIRKKIVAIKPDVIHAWGSEQGAALVAARLKLPFVATVQGLMTWYEELVPLNRYQHFAAWLERRSLPLAPVVTTESTFAVDYLKRRWPQMNVAQVEHAPDWIFHQLKRAPQLAPALRFVFVSSISHIKGGDLLVKALDRLRDEINFQLIVVGRGEPALMEQLRRETSPEIWSRIEFKPELTPAQVADEMARATLMIFPTRADTSPNSVKEAVVAGLPVVASAVGGITDYVWPGRNGILFPSENLDALVRAIRDACAHPRFSRGEVEADALEQARAYLSPRVMGGKFLEIYGKLARR
jgi:glycosyltransferase involved in cell wall biosynthesis